MWNKTIKVILAFVFLSGLAACADRGPSKQQVEELFRGYLQNNLPVNWTGSLMGGKLQRLDLLEVQLIGKSMKKTNGGRMPEVYAATYQDCWPVRIHAKGVASANFIFRVKENPFDQIGSFMLCSTYDDKWGVEGDPFQNEPVKQQAAEDTNTEHAPGVSTNTASSDSLVKFCGIWEYDQYGGKRYFKITKAGNGRFRFMPGDKYEGKINWHDPMLVNADGIYLKSVNGELKGEFVSGNFYATHGQDYIYKISLVIKSDNKLSYSVNSSIRGETDVSDAIKISN